MLTISELASYAGVTVRAVRHYHAKGLLPEPERDRSGYRRYDALAVADLIKIRTLAEAGVPLSRVRELLAADADEFAAAVVDIDKRLRAEIRDRQEHRKRIAQLAAGDNLALPPEAVAYLARMRELGFPELMIAGERDAWILVAAQVPEHMPTFMALKQGQLDDPAVVESYREMGEALFWEPDDARLATIADQIVGFMEDADPAELAAFDEEVQIPDGLVKLLDAVFVDMVPAAPRLLELIEERGWTGWTRMERVDSSHR
ncbi:MerR family transcriptional regulator [Nocardioides speluncae]|uniref:MerR family transcriptional regulator n=1 Tax=Nocardioides speluncae TaxID=2670337 RepID=UPI000D6945C9|nr:MerR family transcriptional regulator [Nocardioides speluncae]